MVRGDIWTRKVAVIGCGFVGAACVFSIMQSGLVSELVLIDVDADRAAGEALDIGHGVPFAKPLKIYAGGYDDLRDASLVVITAGAARITNESRLDLTKKNIAIFNTIIPGIMKSGFRGLLLIVTNPVDILTKIALELSGLPAHMVLGSGTVLDSARLRYELAGRFSVDVRDIDAFVVGEHGDSEVVTWSSANIAGVPIKQFCLSQNISDFESFTEKVAETVRTSASEIIAKKRATYFGIAMAVKRICEAVIMDERSILPVSSALNGEYGISGVALSIPTVVGKSGIESYIPSMLADDEIAKLQRSADVLRDILARNNN